MTYYESFMPFVYFLPCEWSVRQKQLNFFLFEFKILIQIVWISYSIWYELPQLIRLSFSFCCFLLRFYFPFLYLFVSFRINLDLKQLKIELNCCNKNKFWKNRYFLKICNVNFNLNKQKNVVIKINQIWFNLRKNSENHIMKPNYFIS